MNKPKCNVTRKIKKTDEINVARKTIGRMIQKSGIFLQTICSDSGACIAFGKNSDEITSYFNGFTDFKYAVSPIKKIGNPSANGFVKEIEYEKQGYKSHAILKSSQNPKADNLVYEYLVGNKFMNRHVKQFPCFVQTHGLYFYDSEITWQNMKSVTPLEKDALTHLEKQDAINYSKACKESKHAAILIQHMNDAKAFNHYTSNRRFMKNDLLYALFIVYHALSSLSKQFTHYDLHTGNVLLYEPVKGKYIQYMYHNDDGSITTFNSPYMPKIIDYGRSFFDNGNVNSKKIHDKICQIKDCEPGCGKQHGFAHLDTNVLTSYNDVFIISSQKNESHDLRLLFSLQNKLRDISNKPDEHTFLETEKIINKVVYGVGIRKKENKIYGTIENTKYYNNKRGDANKICNVNAAHSELKKVVEMDSVASENRNNYNDIENRLGTLHVYDDGRPMAYEENK